MKKIIKVKKGGTLKKLKVVAKSAAKVAAKETKRLVKKVGVETNKMSKIIQKKWDKAEPERAKYKKEVQAAAKKAGAKGMEMLKRGLKHGYKIGGDIADVIKKDIKEIQNEGKK